MKIIHGILLAGLLISANAKDVDVSSIRHLTKSVDQECLFPRYSMDAKRIYFTQAAYQGLWELDRLTLEVKQISDAPGAGYYPLPLPGETLIFRTDSYESGRKYTSLMLHGAPGQAELVSRQRFLSPVDYSNGRLLFMAGPDLKAFALESELFEAPDHNSTAIFNDRLHLVLFNKGIVSPFAPLGEGQYIWPQMSPSRDRVLFTKAGIGTFISDLQGANLVAFGKANAPQWSPDGKYMIYMLDLDDGAHYTQSEIWLAAADGSERWQLTNTTDQIELYPSWSPDGKTICYHTTNGELFELSLEIRD